MVFVFSIILVTKGIAALEQTTDTIDQTNQDVLKIHNNLVDVSNNLKSVANEATPVRNQLVDFLKLDICPLRPASATESDIRTLGDETLAAMEELDNFIAGNLQDVDKVLTQVLHAHENVEKGVDATDFTGPAAVAILVPFLVIPTLLIVALVMGWMDVYFEGFFFFTTWFVLPLLVLMTLFAAIATGFVAVAVEGNADFCSGGSDNTPESTVQNILGQYNITTETFYHQVITFYSNQCDQAVVDDPWDFLQVYYEELVSVICYDCLFFWNAAGFPFKLYFTPPPRRSTSALLRIWNESLVQSRIS
jgi:hypothetical protein